MDQKAIYEKWRADRSGAEPPEGFADRVMRSLEASPQDATAAAAGAWTERLGRAGRFAVCAAAAIAALVRIAELFGVFAATGIEN